MLQDFLTDVRGRMGGDAEGRSSPPSIFDVIANSINIMQVRITRSRMAGDPPELLITPNLAHLPLLAFDRVAEGIEEGRRAAHRALTAWESAPESPAAD
jgi:NTE family protein